MKRFGILIFVLLACDSGDTPSDAGQDGAGPDLAGDQGLPDGGGPVDEERPATLSPLACQADLAVLREESSAFMDHPLEYKGEIYGIRMDGTERVLRALVSDTVLVRTDQNAPGFGEQTLRFPVGDTQITVAPDWGADNSPAFPVAFNAIMSETGDVLFRMATDGTLAKVIAQGDAVNLGAVSGEVSGFEQVRVSPNGAVVFALILRESRDRHLVQQRTPMSNLELLVATGMALNDTHRVASIEGHDYADGVLVRVGVRADAAQIGFAYLRPLPAGDVQCVMSDTLPCEGGIALSNEQVVPLEDFASDGTGTIAVDRTNGSSPLVRYVLGGRAGTIERGTPIQGFSFNNFKHPRVCTRDGSLRFVGQLDADTTTPHDELMRLDADGTLTQLTDFGAFAGVESLVGEVPDEILNVALGYGCDAVLRTEGAPLEGSTSPYEGYWISYFDGDTLEAIEETPGRADNGNGPVTNISRGRSGLDPNATWNTPENIGPTGAFAFLAQRPEGTRSSYVRATQPANRCRAPNIVNSEGDASDAAPGDGRCDTGAGGDEPECTFRAMIEETNAVAGADVARVEGSLSVRLGAPLPPITSALSLEGNDVLLDGADLSGEEAGLRIEAERVHLRGVRIENFPANGIHASAFVELEDVWSRNNCGWGAWFDAGASIAGRADEPAQYSRNGGEECEGESGGIFQRGDGATMRVSHVHADLNGGPGLVSRGRVDAGGLQATSNGGDGVLIDLDGAGTRALFASFGTLVASENRGHGLALYGGDLRTELANVVVERNCGFGIALEDATAQLFSEFGRPAGMEHRIRNNGSDQATPGGRFFRVGLDGSLEEASRSCGGGGISVIGVEAGARSSLSRIDSAEIDDNDGPGIASSAEWLLGDVTIRRNFGPGVLIAVPPGEDEAAGTTVQFDAGRAQSLIEDNFSHGLELRFGDLRVEGGLVLNRNVGAGARLDDGNASFNLSPGTAFTTVEGSGRAMLMCLHWTPVDGLWQREDRACGVTGGIVTAEGNVDAVGLVVRNNAGPGLSASDGDDEGLGVVTLTGGQVCNNDEADVARVMNYDGVDTDC